MRQTICHCRREKYRRLLAPTSWPADPFSHLLFLWFPIQFGMTAVLRSISQCKLSTYEVWCRCKCCKSMHKVNGINEMGDVRRAESVYRALLPIRRQARYDTYHAAANVHTTIRLIVNSATYNVLSQTGVRYVSLEKNWIYFARYTFALPKQMSAIWICNIMTNELMAFFCA